MNAARRPKNRLPDPNPWPLSVIRKALAAFRAELLTKKGRKKRP